MDKKIWQDFVIRYPWASMIKKQIFSVIDKLEDAFRNNKKLLLAGNGGSMADSLHISGELLKSFEKRRDVDHELDNKIKDSWAYDYLKFLEKGFRVHVLGINPVLQSAFLNDKKISELYYAQELYNIAEPGDIFFAISTSGRSKNLLVAAELANIMDVFTIGLIDQDGTELRKLSKLYIQVPVKGNSADVQEYHLPVYHFIARELERRFYA